MKGEKQMSRTPSEKSESLAFEYCLWNGFRIGYLIGKYGLDYVEQIDRDQLIFYEEHNRMFWESREAYDKFLESDLESDLESALKTLLLMKG